jgi:glycosyltransferase involved in cell wall biosynthesis
MSHPEISIILPVFNCQSYIINQIDSLLTQSFQNFELIVVDDGSTDSTRSIIEEYCQVDNRICIYDNEYIKGISGALNTGLKYAKSEFIARCDGDDIDSIDRLKIQYNFLKTNPEYKIIGSGIEVFNRAKTQIIYYPSNPFILAWNFISDTFFCHPTVMFSRTILETINSYPNCDAEDFAFFSVAIRYNKCTNLPLVLKRYRESLTNLSNIKKTEIENNVKELFENNFDYYFPNDNPLKVEFYNYQKFGKVTIKLFPKLMRMNLKILDKVRVNYSLKRNNLYFLSAFVYLFFNMFIMLVNNTVRNLRKFNGN